ncbi:helix-turn-helix domain-containing protein [Gordonia sp. (in: high G+C Gram-positive bacteria)]|uniref:helix-turn-helix domain-containing protein n=1 Tax=Gordonia sp. (in: high G+C Gram-positive bacteria) TaxID=84139 RepID=UPI0039E700F1
MTVQNNAKVLYSLAHAAEAVDVSVDTLRREFKAHRLAVKTIGGRYFVTHQELERWAADLEPAIPGGAA